MYDPDNLCGLFDGSSIADQWRRLIDLYHVMEEETGAFCQAYDIHCPQGCGTCCEHFIPDLTSVEASLIAGYLLFETRIPLLVGKLHESGGTACPLYDPDSGHHCTVYPVRGLICRLFGACPSEDKRGLPVFRKCKYNEDPKARSLSENDISQPVPTMQRYSVEFSAIDDGGGTKPLGEAVMEQMNRLRFLAAYLENGSDDDDNGGSDPLLPTPNPIAS